MVISIIISIIASILITYFFTRLQMKNNKIVHYLTNSFEIGKGLSDDFPEFKLTFNGSEMNTSVRMLEGGFMNTGKRDIASSPSFDFILPTNCIIRAINIIVPSEDMKVNSKIDETNSNIAHFTIEDNFNVGEYFEYKAIIESPESIEKISKKITIKHRKILNTDFKNMVVGSIREKETLERISMWLLIFVSIYFLLSCTLMYFRQPLKVKVVDKFTKEEASILIGPQSKLYKEKFLLGDELTKKEFEENYTFTPDLAYKKDNVFFIILGFVPISMLCVMLIGQYKSRDKRRVIKVLKQANKERESEKNKRQNKQVAES